MGGSKMIKKYSAIIMSLGALTACSGSSVTTEGGATRDLLSQKIRCVEMAERYIRNMDLSISKRRIWGVRYSDEKNTCLARFQITDLDNSLRIAGDGEEVVDTVSYKTLAAVGRTREENFKMTTYQAFIFGEKSDTQKEDLEVKAERVRQEMRRLMGEE
jgi:hypothetical protein